MNNNIKRIQSLSTVFLGVLFMLFVNSCKNLGEKEHQDLEIENVDLKAARSDFKTKIIDHSFVGDGVPAVPPKEILELIYYPAEDGKMASYITPDPKDGKKYPALIWVHGGYGGIGDFFWEPQSEDNDQSGRVIRESGIVMMIPSFRGENDNPGNYEMFYGEINDLESAREYLAKLPYVDPNRIYLAGHSTGGTTALLGSEFSKGFRAVFSLGGIPDLKLRLEAGSMMVQVPFDQNNPEEFKLRSPITFIKSFTSPTFYFEGDDYWWHEFDDMQKIAAENNIPFYSYKIRNADHFNVIVPVTKVITKKILADTAEDVNIKIEAADVKWIEENVMN